MDKLTKEFTLAKLKEALYEDSTDTDDAIFGVILTMMELSEVLDTISSVVGAEAIHEAYSDWEIDNPKTLPFEPSDADYELEARENEELHREYRRNKL